MLETVIELREKQSLKDSQLENNIFNLTFEEHFEFWMERTKQEFDCSAVFQCIKERNRFQELTGFTENELTSLLRRVQPFCPKELKRGPKCKLSWVDSCLLLLVYYRVYPNIETLAKDFKITTYVCITIIDRYRKVFHNALTQEWITNRSRPQKMNHPVFPFVGMNFDHTSFQIPKPFMDFESAKRFWDSKHRMYSLKKGVGISPVSGYAMFITSKVEGAVHDYEDFKSKYTPLIDYLRKRDDEKALFPIDVSIEWAISMDRGYIGDANDTIGIRRLFIKRNVASNEDRQYNKHLFEVHKIEHFFGRLKKLWKITNAVYRNDKSHFDVDIENCILLTNEDIRFRKLANDDHEFYLSSQKQLFDLNEQVTLKRKLQYKQYQNNKRMRSIQDMERM